VLARRYAGRESLLTRLDGDPPRCSPESRAFPKPEKPLLLTTNRPFAEWNQTFPNASCVITLVDRLVLDSSELSGAERHAARS